MVQQRSEASLKADPQPLPQFRFLADAFIRNENDEVEAVRVGIAIHGSFRSLVAHHSMCQVDLAGLCKLA